MQIWKNTLGWAVQACPGATAFE